MTKASPEAVARDQLEMADWEKEHSRLQALLPVQASRDRLKTLELPDLERQIDELEASLPAISSKAEEVRN
jgi:DNA repair protein RAD50